MSSSEIEEPTAYKRKIDLYKYLLEKDQEIEAVSVLEDLSLRFPNRPDAFVALAEYYQNKNNWELALLYWNKCLSSFPRGNINGWLRLKVHCLIHVGAYAAAEEIMHDLCSDNPDRLLLATFASLAMRQEHWVKAIMRWDEVLGKFPANLKPEWVAARARSLDKAGRLDEAAEAYRDAAVADPTNTHCRLRFLELAGRTDPPDSALYETQHGILRETANFEELLISAELALRCDRMLLLQTKLRRLISTARTVEDCHKIFPMIAPAFEGWDRTNAWLELESQMQKLSSPSEDRRETLRATLSMRLKLALRDYQSFKMLYESMGHTLAPRWAERLRRLALMVDDQVFPDYEKPKVFGIGLSKTGTTSLAKALEILGYQTAHYTNDFTMELLNFDDASMYDALTDTPVSAIFEQLFFSYRNSRFIYTSRPMNDWVRSYNNHYRRHLRTSDFEVLRQMLKRPGLTRYGKDRSISAVQLFYRFGDPQEAREAFEIRIKDFFSESRAHRLLVYDVFSGDGWDKLCRFLRRPIPKQSYPKENTASSLD